MSCIYGIEQRCEECRMCEQRSTDETNKTRESVTRSSRREKTTIESVAMEIRKLLQLKTPIAESKENADSIRKNIIQMLNPPKNQREQRTQTQVLLAVLMPKPEFDQICNQYKYNGLLYDHIDYDKVADYFVVTRSDVIDRYRDLYPNYLL